MQPTGPTFRIHTLGCRVNHAERRALEVVLKKEGLQHAAEGTAATIEVIHSCAVTSRAASKSRNAARRARRGQSPETGDSLVLVTGCLGADPSGDRNIEAAGGRENLIGHARPEDPRDMVDRFGDRVRQFLTAIAPTPRATQALRVLGQPPMRGQRQHSGHVRAELKIQDGCDAHCTFCIIPTLRPVLRSKPVAEVVQEARMLVDAGHIELVLTGIFIGAFGHETALRRKQTNRFASPLADLLDAVAQVPGLERLRLSSMEPGDVDTPLLDVMVSHASTIVPHLHLPLQSGSDAILRRMNRQYTTGDYRDMLGAVNAALTTSDGLGPALTTDVICGFPGETPEDAQATVDLALEASFLHMHVFPYSPRPGTAAARWTTQAVPSTIARERVRRLIRLETGPNGLRQAFQKHLLGRELRVILESPDAARPGRWLGRCDHYAQLSVQCDESRLSPRSGQMVRAIPTTIDDDVLLATRVQASVALPVLVPQ